MNIFMLNSGGFKREFYFKTDEKTGKVRVFTKGYDEKNLSCALFLNKT